MQMNTISMNIYYSNLIKYHFQKYLSLTSRNAGSDPESFIERYSNISALMDAIMAIMGPLMPVNQINLYDMDGKMVGSGRFNGETSVDLKKMPWYEKTMKLDGNRCLGTPITLKWLNDLNVLYKDNVYLSLTRVYKNSNNESQGIIEVIQNCDTLFKYANEIRHGNADTGIYIIDSDGQSVYPYRNASERNGKYYYSLIQNTGLNMLETHSITNFKGTVKQAMTYTVSKKTGWTIIVVQTQSVIFKSVYRFAGYYIILAILVIGITLAVSYLVSKSVTVPLKKLGNEIKRMELADLSTGVQVHRSNGTQYVDEIEKLHFAFTEMNRKLGISLNEILTSKNEELNAKLLAMQSQMNPHFFHNSLATISVMAEEEMNQQIISLCSDISYMLRYIATEDRNGVKLRMEMEYTKKYLNSMKIRYEDDLNYEFRIDEGMLDLIVPKLIVQPLVENSIKFALKQPPQWCILITGKISDGKWLITVTDNGPGFDPRELQKIKQFKKDYTQFSVIPDLKIGGMGLPNVYIRLRLLYKESTVFEAENLPGGGASIMIGGDLSQPGGKEQQHV